jgi:aryl-alcohol dehydrogenase-like predicted oxidoreductase
VKAIGAEIGATSAQTALAWILTRGNDIATIPGTRRVNRVEENMAADAIEVRSHDTGDPSSLGSRSSLA